MEPSIPLARGRASRTRRARPAAPRSANASRTPVWFGDAGSVSACWRNSAPKTTSTPRSDSAADSATGLAAAVSISDSTRWDSCAASGSLGLQRATLVGNLVGGAGSRPWSVPTVLLECLYAAVGPAARAIFTSYSPVGAQGRASYPRARSGTRGPWPDRGDVLAVTSVFPVRPSARPGRRPAPEGHRRRRQPVGLPGGDLGGRATARQTDLGPGRGPVSGRGSSRLR